MAEDLAPEISVQSQWPWLSRIRSEEKPERQTNTNQHHCRKWYTLKLLHLLYVKRVSEWIKKMWQPLGVRTVMKTANTLRSSLVQVKQPRPDMKKKGRCSLPGVMQGLLVCVHWRDRKNIGDMNKWTQDSGEEESPQEWDCSSCLDELVVGQMGSCLSLTRGMRLQEKKGPKGPTHPPTTSDFKP